MRCLYCSADVSELDKFCKNCGKIIEKKNKYCLNCQKTYPITEQFCDDCGIRLVDSLETFGEPVKMKSESTGEIKDTITEGVKNDEYEKLIQSKVEKYLSEGQVDINELLNKARLLESEGKFVEAREVCLEILVLASGGKILFPEMDIIGECRKILESIKIRRIESGLEKVKKCITEGNYQEAIKISEQLSNDYPENEDLKQIHYEAMEANFQRKRNEEEDKIKGGEVRKKKRVEKLIQMGNTFSQKGKMLKAVNCIKRALNLDSENKELKERLKVFKDELAKWRTKIRIKCAIISTAILVLGAICFGLTFLMELPFGNEVWFFVGVGLIGISVILFIIGLAVTGLYRFK